MADVLFVLAFLLLTAAAGLIGTAVGGLLVGAGCAAAIAGVGCGVVALALTDGRGLKGQAQR